MFKMKVNNLIPNRTAVYFEPIVWCWFVIRTSIFMGIICNRTPDWCECCGAPNGLLEQHLVHTNACIVIALTDRQTKHDRQNMTQVKGVYRTHFRWTSPSLLSAGATNTLENNVACDMPGQIPYMSWLILIMPLSTSMLNCAISFGKRRAGELFYSNWSA